MGAKDCPSKFKNRIKGKSRPDKKRPNKLLLFKEEHQKTKIFLKKKISKPKDAFDDAKKTIPKKKRHLFVSVRKTDVKRNQEKHLFSLSVESALLMQSRRKNKEVNSFNKELVISIKWFAPIRKGCFLIMDNR